MNESRERFLREKVVPFHTSMSCLLRFLARGRIRSGTGREHPARLAECLLAGEGYSVRIVCRNRGIRPFLAFMEHPWRHRAYLGRLRRDGEAHVFDYGLKIFFNQLCEEGVLDVFLRDLQQMVAELALEFAAARRATCGKEHCPDCASHDPETPGCRKDRGDESPAVHPGHPTAH